MFLLEAEFLSSYDLMKPGNELICFQNAVAGQIHILGEIRKKQSWSQAGLKPSRANSSGLEESHVAHAMSCGLSGTTPLPLWLEGPASVWGWCPYTCGSRGNPAALMLLESRPSLSLEGVPRSQLGSALAHPSESHTPSSLPSSHPASAAFSTGCSAFHAITPPLT